MFIVCSNCDFKYLVNSADLKPNGRMVECANCGHEWYQELSETEPSASIPPSKKENTNNYETINQKQNNEDQVVKNLPSTLVKQDKPSILNSIIVIFLILIIFIGIWLSNSFGVNTFILIDFYINEFFFNLNLIISDLAKIIYNILN